MSNPQSYTLNFLGDVMLGRLIDQLLPTHVHEPSEARHVAHFRSQNPDLKTYTHATPWGNTLPLLHSSDLNFINLEIAVTTHPEPWPDKTFNYRMHPANVEALKLAQVDYVSLANNHILDFNVEGLRETVKTLDDATILHAGAGRTRDEALRPAILHLPGLDPTSNPDSTTAATSSSNNPLIDPKESSTSTPIPPSHTISAFSASDHPTSWSTIPPFHLIDYSSTSRSHLSSLLNSSPSPSPPSPHPHPPTSLTLLSLHWGPNYTWLPSPSIRSLAQHILTTTPCDIIHGHSSHHVQGFEIFDVPVPVPVSDSGGEGAGVERGGRTKKTKKKLVLYGCGDFLSDYALVPEFRNDLGAVWRVTVSCPPSPPSSPHPPQPPQPSPPPPTQPLELKRLSIFPTRIRSFQTNLLDKDDEDAKWVREKIVRLSREMGWRGEYWVGEGGEVVVEL
ncbi:MAG: hypothetical protein Q9160_007309 [Pyrenula sp. 1 TL-2023]